VPNKPHPWPTNAKNARDDAADACVASLLALQPLITGRGISDADSLRHLAVINHNLQFIKGTLESVGAKTRMTTDYWCLPRGAINGN
jgi:hypothetical protein